MKVLTLHQPWATLVALGGSPSTQRSSGTCPACRGSAVGKRVVRRCPGPARPEDFLPCQVCRRTPGRCDPIPFKGGQGLSREVKWW